MAKIEWTQTALTDLEKVDRLIAQKIVRKVNWFVNNFENISPDPLAKEIKGLFKFRVGDWRVVYALEGDQIVIQFVGHRSEIYKRVKR